MDFEYDEVKSVANATKHGIDFEEARAIWDDPFFVIVPAKTSDEARFLAIGEISGRCWTAVFTPRHGRIRLISVRRSRQTEVSLYEGA